MFFDLYCSFFFFFNDTATTEIYTLSLHDALPFCAGVCPHGALQDLLLIKPLKVPAWLQHALGDRKSTRLNSSHVAISYAVFCLKKKNNKTFPLFQIKNKKTTHKT